MSNSTLSLWIDAENSNLLSGWSSAAPAVLPSLKQGDNATVDLYWLKLSQNTGLMQDIGFPAGSIVRLAIGNIDSSPSAGSFTLTYGGDTAIINYDDTASEVSTALNNLTSVIADGGVTVQLVNQFAYRIVFNNNGARSLFVSDSSNLIPTTVVSVRRIKTGSSTVKEVQYIKPKVSPIAYCDTFVDSPTPVATATSISSVITRISISGNPRAGTFTISNGTLTTPAIPVRSTAPTVLQALEYCGLSNTTRVYSTDKIDDFTWDISLLVGTPETLTTSADGVIPFLSKTGSISLNTQEVEDFLAGAKTADATIEIEVESAGIHQTLYQGNITIINDLIDDTTYAPSTLPSPIGEAPADGEQYTRKDTGWTILQIDGGIY